jgi:hypothetical protein
MHLIIRDDSQDVAALRNVFRHAQAGRVEVEIRYGSDDSIKLRTTGKVSIKTSRPSLRDTTDCAVCGNAPHSQEVN